MKLRRIATAFGLLPVVVWMIGCSSFQQAKQKASDTNELKLIGLAWHNYLDSNQGNAPTKAEDLFQHLGGATWPPAQALKSGKYVVYWGVSIKDIQSAKNAPDTSTVVLAYAASTPTSGGLVAMVDGFVKEMSASEFSAAKKASDFKKKG